MHLGANLDSGSVVGSHEDEVVGVGQMNTFTMKKVKAWLSVRDNSKSNDSKLRQNTLDQQYTCKSAVSSLNFFFSVMMRKILLRTHFAQRL